MSHDILVATNYFIKAQFMDATSIIYIILRSEFGQSSESGKGWESGKDSESLKDHEQLFASRY